MVVVLALGYLTLPAASAALISIQRWRCYFLLKNEVVLYLFESLSNLHICFFCKVCLLALTENIALVLDFSHFEG